MAVVTDWGTAIVSALANAVNLILGAIPRLLGFIIILAVGLLIAYFVRKGVTFLLRKIGFDRLSDRIGLRRFERNLNVSMDAADVLGQIVYWFIVLIFLVPASDALGVPAVSNVLNSIVEFIPNVFVAILVLFLGALLAVFISDIVRGATATARVGNPNVFAAIARYAIIGFSILIALEQLNIAPALINELFGAVVAGGALAFGLAFGLGGRDAAKRMLDRTEVTVSALSTAAAQGNLRPPTTPPASVDDPYAAPVRTAEYDNRVERPQQAPVYTNAPAPSAPAQQVPPPPQQQYTSAPVQPPYPNNAPAQPPHNVNAAPAQQQPYNNNAPAQQPYNNAPAQQVPPVSYDDTPTQRNNNANPPQR